MLSAVSLDLTDAERGLAVMVVRQAYAGMPLTRSDVMLLRSQEKEELGLRCQGCTYARVRGVDAAGKANEWIVDLEKTRVVDRQARS